MDYVSPLPKAFEDALATFIKQKFEERDLKTAFPNPLLQDDILELLEREEHCKVVYFPLPDEDNHGFQIRGVPSTNGEIYTFVFINTEQTMEKQVFTAAHELGHIWGADDYIFEHMVIEEEFVDNDKSREMIINRFAATLLMPEKEFRAVVKAELKKYQAEDKSVNVNDMLKIIVTLMNQFFVPYIAVVRRLWELDYFPEDTARVFLGNSFLSKKILYELVNKWISYFGYSKLQRASKRKGIDDLPELLDIAEKKQLVSPKKIKKLRDMFELKSNIETIEIHDTVSIKERP